MDDRACCCPSRPVVRVLMPATPGRPYRVDLLLCGHHYRLAQWTLAAAGGVARVLPAGRAADVFGAVHVVEPVMLSEGGYDPRR